MKSPEYTRQVWRECIFQSFGADENSKEICKTFDALTSSGKMSPQGAAGIVISSHSSNGKEMCENIKSLVEHAATSSDVSEFIHRELAKKAKEGGPIEQSSVKRLIDVCRRHDRNLDILKSIEVGGVTLSAEELEKIKSTSFLPNILKSQSFDAVASTEEKQAKNLSLQIWF